MTDGADQAGQARPAEPDARVHIPRSRRDQERRGADITLPRTHASIVRTDWLRNTLTVSGRPADLAGFQTRARGTNAAPWHLDLDHEEARLLAPMAAAGAPARALARALRDAIAARHDRVLAQWHHAGSCPLDLHRLVPIPDAILCRGQDDPAAQAWLRAHWGTTQPLRQVWVREAARDRRLRRAAKTVFAFHAADWTPWQAILRMRRDWPGLIFHIQPHYDDDCDDAGAADA